MASSSVGLQATITFVRVRLMATLSRLGENRNPATSETKFGALAASEMATRRP